MRVEYKKFEPTRKFGVEIEVDQTLNKKELAEIISQKDPDRKVHVEGGATSPKWAESVGNAFWHVKYDSTCGPLGKGKDTGGWEVASYVGSGIKDIENIAAVGEFLGENQAKVNGNCGLHVHVETKDFSAKEIGKLLAYWIKIESFMFHANPSHRKGNKYCKSMRSLYESGMISDGIENPLSSKELDPIQIWDVLKPKNHYPHENDEKKVTLNTLGVAKYLHDSCQDKRVTVEWRVPECMLQRKHISNCTKFILQFVDSCKDKEMPEDLSEIETIPDMLTLMGLYSKGSFLILDSNLYELKLWFLGRVSEFSSNRKIAAEARQFIDFITLV